MEVTVVNRQRGHAVTGDSLAAFVDRLIRVAPPGEHDSLAVALVGDRRMRELNRRFRGHDSTTDVLSFPAGDEPSPAGERHLGDIVISVATAARQAEQARHSLEDELEYLLLHGYLHLLGYDHETDDGTMLRLQGRLTRKLSGTRAKEKEGTP